jgi:hypothetical protein
MRHISESSSARGSRREQRPEQHGGGLCRGKHGLRFDAALELLVQPFDLHRSARQTVCGLCPRDGHRTTVTWVLFRGPVGLQGVVNGATAALRAGPNANAPLLGDIKAIFARLSPTATGRSRGKVGGTLSHAWAHRRR